MTGADSSNACGRHAKVRLRHGWKWPAKSKPWSAGDSLWERACSRRGRIRWHRCCL